MALFTSYDQLKKNVLGLKEESPYEKIPYGPMDVLLSEDSELGCPSDEGLLARHSEQLHNFPPALSECNNARVPSYDCERIISEGDEFVSFDELAQKLIQLQHAHKVRLLPVVAKKIRRLYTKRSGNMTNPSLLYYNLTYGCATHCGVDMQFRLYDRITCPYRIDVGLTRCHKFLVIKSLVESHNHSFPVDVQINHLQEQLSSRPLQPEPDRRRKASLYGPNYREKVFNFAGKFSDLRNERRLCDLELRCVDAPPVRVHKYVLSLRSDPLRLLLNKHHVGALALDCTAETLLGFVEVLYGQYVPDSARTIELQALLNHFNIDVPFTVIKLDVRGNRMLDKACMTDIAGLLFSDDANAVNRNNGCESIIRTRGMKNSYI